MTVSTTTNKITYVTDGVTTIYTVPFKFINDYDLIVYVNQTQLILNTDYTVQNAGNPSGGTITTAGAYSSGNTLIIVRQVPYTQETDYVSNDLFPAETHELALDKLTMLGQQLSESSNRSLKLPITNTTSINTDMPPPIGGYMFGWNATGNGIININPATYYQAAGSFGFTVQTFTGTGSTTTFTLTNAVGSIQTVEVFIDGVRQTPTADYYMSGTNNTVLNIITAPVLNSVILVRYGTTMATTVPADGSVTPEKISSNGPVWTATGRPVYNGFFPQINSSTPTATLAPADYVNNSYFTFDGAGTVTVTISSTGLGTTATAAGITIQNGTAFIFCIKNDTGNPLTVTSTNFSGNPTIPATYTGQFAVTRQAGIIWVYRLA